MGGGCRKNKRSSSASSSSKRVQDQGFSPNPNPLSGLPSLSYDTNDLTLALARLQKQSLGYDEHDLSILGNPNGTPCDNILGNHHGMNTNPGFLDALRSGFLGTQNNMQSMYYGYGNGDMGEVDNGNACGGVSGEMMLPYDQEMSVASTQAVTVTTMKQELCNGREQSHEGKVLWGFPWQLNRDTNMGELDSGRANWNGLTSSWHGLLNSPLM